MDTFFIFSGNAKKQRTKYPELLKKNTQNSFKNSVSKIFQKDNKI